MTAMGSRGMSYAGDATLTSNYVELAVPKEAQALIVECAHSPLYELIKDFALNRMARWIPGSSSRRNAP